MSIRRVQKAGGQDGRAQSGEGWSEEQLEGNPDAGEPCACLRPRKALEDAIDALIIRSVFENSETEIIGCGQYHCRPTVRPNERPRKLHTRSTRGGPMDSTEVSTPLFALQSVQILDQPLLDDHAKQSGGILFDND